MNKILSFVAVLALTALAVPAAASASTQTCPVKQSPDHTAEGLPSVWNVRVTGVSCEVAVGQGDYLEGGERGFRKGHNESIVDYLDQWQIGQGVGRQFRVTVRRLVTKKLPLVVEHWTCRTNHQAQGTKVRAVCDRGDATVAASFGS
jgi:hypothetical protein